MASFFYSVLDNRYIVPIFSNQGVLFGHLQRRPFIRLPQFATRLQNIGNNFVPYLISNM